MDLDAVKSVSLRAKTNPAAVPELLDSVNSFVLERVKATRASVWSFNAGLDEIRLESLKDTLPGTVSRGTVLSQADFKPYFAAIKQDLKVVAPDARRHPATSCFNKVYFEPLDIHSLLDFVVLSRTDPVAVLCCEQCEAPRAWTPQDLDVLLQMATVLGTVWRHLRLPGA